MSNPDNNTTSKIDIYFALGQYTVIVLNAIFFLHDILFISLNLLAATMLLISFIYLFKIRNPFYPYLTFAIMICYFVINIELLFDLREGLIGTVIQITAFILFVPWIIYAIRTIRTPLVARDKILRMWTTYSYVEDEKEREDYTDGLDHGKNNIREKRKEIRGKYNAFIVQILSAIYVFFFIVTYLFGLL